MTGEIVAGWTERPAFDTLPRAVRAGLETALGSEVVLARDATGGMSPGAAAVLELGDGRQVFAKVLDRSVNARSVELVEAERVVLAQLPESVPHAPLVLATDIDGWAVTVVEAVVGTMVPTPWGESDLERVPTAYGVVASHRELPGLRPVLETEPDLDGWAQLSEQPEAVRALGFEPELVASWAELVGDWRALVVGDALCHNDARADNILVGPAGVTIVDWSFGSVGPAWHDPTLVCLDVLGDGAPGARAIALAHLRELGPDARRVAVGFIGMLTRNSTLPPHAGLPTFRSWQRRRAERLWPVLEDLAYA